MAGPKHYPQGMRLWPDRAIGLSTQEVVKAYEDGFVGAYSEPEEEDKFDELVTSHGGFVEGQDAAIASGWNEDGKDQLVAPFVWVQWMFPECWPGAGQDVGDCVSHNEKNANMLTYACEILEGKPDEVTGRIEEVPHIPTLGLRQGAFSTEAFYWFRRHGGHGWSCSASAQVAMKEAGLVTRDNHSRDIGIDLTSYSGDKASKYGRTPPTGSIADALDNNLIRQSTRIRNFQEVRDFLLQGYGISTCGSEGFSNKRDEYGVSRRRGSWAHAMAYIGADDRPEIHSLVGDSLVLVLNSWATWNSGGRDVYQSAKYLPAVLGVLSKRFNMPEGVIRTKLIDLDILNGATSSLKIPRGSFWARWRDVSSRTCFAKASVNGWPARKVSLGFEEI